MLLPQIPENTIFKKKITFLLNCLLFFFCRRSRKLKPWVDESVIINHKDRIIRDFAWIVNVISDAIILLRNKNDFEGRRLFLNPNLLKKKKAVSSTGCIHSLNSLHSSVA